MKLNNKKLNIKLFFVFAMVFSLTLAAGGLFVDHASAQGASYSTQCGPCATPGAGLSALDSHIMASRSPALRWYSSGNAAP